MWFLCIDHVNTRWYCIVMINISSYIDFLNKMRFLLKNFHIHDAKQLIDANDCFEWMFSDGSDIRDTFCFIKSASNFLDDLYLSHVDVLDLSIKYVRRAIGILPPNSNIMRRFLNDLNMQYTILNDLNSIFKNKQYLIDRECILHTSEKLKHYNMEPVMHKHLSEKVFIPTTLIFDKLSDEIQSIHLPRIDKQVYSLEKLFNIISERNG